MTTEADPARFAHVTDWVFDLDNTLYPHHSNLFSQIDVKMTAYVSELLKLPREAARKLQKELYLEYGTTLNGLMNRHGINPDDFLEKVHDIDYSWLKPDPVLGAAIRQLPGRKFIFTNGNRGHAEKTARQLGILDHFDDIFDIIAAGLNPKPAPETYDLFLASYGVAAIAVGEDEFSPRQRLDRLAERRVGRQPGIVDVVDLLQEIVGIDLVARHQAGQRRSVFEIELLLQLARRLAR